MASITSWGEEKGGGGGDTPGAKEISELVVGQDFGLGSTSLKCLDMFQVQMVLNVLLSVRGVLAHGTTEGVDLVQVDGAQVVAEVGCRGRPERAKLALQLDVGAGVEVGMVSGVANVGRVGR